MSYIGNPIVSTDFPVDYASGNGSTTAFTLSVAPASVNSIDVQISGVSQSPQTYSVSGTTLTFSAAPPSGTNNIVVRHLGVAGIPNTPSAASVVTASIANNAVTPAKMANGGDEFGMRNRIINGAMVIDQRNAGASGTANGYTVDRWQFNASLDTKGTWQQNAGSVTPPVGFTNYLGFTSNSAYSVPAGELFTFQQRIEGYNVADLGWGTASAKTVTLSFQVYSSLTGTFGGSLRNSAGNRSYPFSYSVPVANTWTTVSVTIAGDTSGTWLTTNGIGINVIFSLGTGTTYSGTAGTWAATNYTAPTGATSVVGTNGATFYITGVQLEVGTTATNFDFRSYGTELALCQRYYSKSFSTEIAPANGRSYDTAQDFTAATYAGNEAWLNMAKYPVTMRTTPSITFYSTSLGTTDGKWTAYTSSSWAALGANAVVMNNSDGFSSSASKAGGWSANQGVMILGHWAASAEL